MAMEVHRSHLHSREASVGDDDGPVLPPEAGGAAADRVRDVQIVIGLVLAHGEAPLCL